MACLNSEQLQLPLTEEEEGYLEVWNATFAFAKPMVMKAAILLGIPDVLDAKGPLTLEQIAQETSSKNTDMLFRIMRFLVSHDIFSKLVTVDSKTGESTTQYGLTKASQWLVTRKEKCLAPYILLVLLEAGQAQWHHLQDCVLGKNAKTKTVYDLSIDNPGFDLFNRAMAARSYACMDTIVKHKDVFQGINTLVDVGGGIGLVTSKIMEAFPHITGINFDRPNVIATAPTFPGVKQVAGDMFVEVPTADAVMVKTVLHGYGDETCAKILNNCHKALPETGKLIVVDYFLNEGNPTGYACDMLMGAVSISGSGRDRTQSEWTTLLNSAGFPIVKFHPMLGSSMCIIEAFKH